MSMFVISETLAADKPVAAPPSPPPVPAVFPTASFYEPIKATLEFVCALFLLILTAPLILIAMLLIKLTSPGPTVYTQTRIGKNGRPFTIYKLRTMTHNCESSTGAQWCKPGDTRITPLGWWLRKTHIDELPQLWNVLKGEMSLVGPRPERPEFVPTLEQAIPLYRERLRVRPGLTGFAQVQLPPDTDLDSVRTKLAYDLHYICRLSLLFDVAIYLATIAKLVGLSESAARCLCRLPAPPLVEREYRRLASGTRQEATDEPSAAEPPRMIILGPGLTPIEPG